MQVCNAALCMSISRSPPLLLSPTELVKGGDLYQDKSLWKISQRVITPLVLQPELKPVCRVWASHHLHHNEYRFFKKKKKNHTITTSCLPAKCEVVWKLRDIAEMWECAISTSHIDTWVEQGNAGNTSPYGPKFMRGYCFCPEDRVGLRGYLAHKFGCFRHLSCEPRGAEG
jgi:hypothetical protein